MSQFIISDEDKSEDSTDTLNEATVQNTLLNDKDVGKCYTFTFFVTWKQGSNQPTKDSIIVNVGKNSSSFIYPRLSTEDYNSTPSIYELNQYIETPPKDHIVDQTHGWKNLLPNELQAVTVISVTIEEPPKEVKCPEDVIDDPIVPVSPEAPPDQTKPEETDIDGRKIHTGKGCDPEFLELDLAYPNELIKEKFYSLIKKQLLSSLSFDAKSGQDKIKYYLNLNENSNLDANALMIPHSFDIQGNTTPNKVVGSYYQPYSDDPILKVTTERNQFNVPFVCIDNKILSLIPEVDLVKFIDPGTTNISCNISWLLKIKFDVTLKINAKLSFKCGDENIEESTGDMLIALKDNKLFLTLSTKNKLELYKTDNKAVGQGFPVNRHNQNIIYQFAPVTCTNCRGTGSVRDKPCISCSGAAKVALTLNSLLDIVEPIKFQPDDSPIICKENKYLWNTNVISPRIIEAIENKIPTLKKIKASSCPCCLQSIDSIKITPVFTPIPPVNILTFGDSSILERGKINKKGEADPKSKFFGFPTKP